MSVETYYLMNREAAAPEPMPELSVVETLREVETDEGQTVPSGSRGTVVAIYEGSTAYEVEFARPVVGLATILASALRPAAA